MKKWILLTAVLCCLLALAGCGSVQDADGSETEASRADSQETDSSIEDVSGADVVETDSPEAEASRADLTETDSPVETEPETDVAESSKLDAIISVRSRGQTRETGSRMCWRPIIRG